MKVRKGFSTEFARDRFDVEVDDTDLDRIYVEYGIGPVYQEQMTTVAVFLILDSLAEWFVLSESLKVLAGEALAAAQQKAAAAKQVHLDTIAQVKAFLGVPAAPAPAQAPADGNEPAAAG